MVDHPSANLPGPPQDGGGPTGTLALIRRWRWMIVSAALAAGVISYAVASSGSPTYESHVVLLVGPISTNDNDTLTASGQLAETYAELATTRPVLNTTSRRVGGVRDIEDSVAASANAVTRLLTISVTTRDPALSSRIANAEARVLKDIGARGQAAVTGQPAADGKAVPAGAGSGTLHVVDPAEPASDPSGRGALALAVLAAIAAALAAVGFAFFLDRSGDAIGDIDELRAVTGAGVIATMTPAVLTPRRRRIGSRTHVKRDFHLLAAKLNAVGDRSLLIVVLGGDGLAFTAELGEALVGTGANVVVVDAAHPQVVSARDVVLADGRGDPLGGGDETAGANTPGWPVRFVSPPPDDDGRGADGARAIVDELLEETDIVLVTPPALEDSPSALTWARVVDGTVVVVPLERTGRGQLSAVVENLRLVHARLLGSIVVGGSSTR